MNTYDVNASVYELNGDGSDGAYDLLLEGATPEEIGRKLTEVLSSDWGLTGSDGPFRLEIHIGPAGSRDVLPL
jgi:hypothetical protein